MDRFVTQLNAYDPATFELLGTGITHYRVPWVEGMQGGRPGQGSEPATGLLAQLIAAGLPDSTTTTLRDAPSGRWIDIAILLDDEGVWESAIASVVGEHVTVEVPIHLAALAAAAEAAEGGGS